MKSKTTVHEDACASCGKTFRGQTAQASADQLKVHVEGCPQALSWKAGPPPLWKMA